VAEVSKTRVNHAGENMTRWWFGEPIPSRDELWEEYRIMDDWRASHAYPMALCAPGIRNWVGRVSSIGIPPAQRLKRMPRIIAKLARHKGMKLARMQDIGGVRAVLGSPLEVDAVAARVNRYWEVARVSDYRDVPRPDTGYRALHVMTVKRGRVVEIQLRTQRQQLWAEEIERVDDRLGLDLKDGQGPPELVEYFRKASDLLWLQEQGAKPDREFIRTFNGIREQVRPYFAANR
jgi:hypothetical protein